ncbi:adenosine deaminase [Mumia flava]|uniref:Adenosine deaminase n=1 Tax=Mumia flava TaxID=1348852 RepID=A0A2M9BKU9_9ACTN|nr:adenosine deaminase [Mumia flava]PJJ58563.1 adenosine deaminase [Mumia flava]
MTSAPTIPYDVVRAWPKVSLHCHLLGSVHAATVADLARKHGETLPYGRSAADLYEIEAYEDLGAFLATYDVVGSLVRDVEDVHRITYESLTTYGSEHGVLYREIFVSPHPVGVPYAVLLDGMRAAMADARADAGIDSRIVVALHRERSASEAEALVDAVVEHRIDEVVGVGLDYAEVNGPPGLFADAFVHAGRAGLERTAHSESGPPRHIEVILDDLGCSRIDHGYHVVTDPRIVQRCLDEGVTFTCTPVSSDIGRYSGSGDGRHERIAAMHAAGLRITIDSDDPPMFGTDPTRDHAVISTALGLTTTDLARISLDAVAATWLDETDRTTLRGRVTEAIAALDPTVLDPTALDRPPGAPAPLHAATTGRTAP